MSENTQRVINKVKDIAEAVFYVLIFIGISIHILKPSKATTTESVKIIEKIDTVVQTVTEERVVYRNVVRQDTVWMTRVESDTITIHDTVRVVIPIERKVYADSLYRAVVSGYRPSLDTIVVYPLTRTIEITKTTPPRRVSVGITVGPQAGYYATPKGWQPGIGIGVSAGITFDLTKTNKHRKYE